MRFHICVRARRACITAGPEWLLLRSFCKLHVLYRGPRFLEQWRQASSPFQGWGDVYYFCGSDMRFCTCDFKWNWAGWRKAFTLWNFILTTALGLQKLAIKVGLNGLLPGRQRIIGCAYIAAALQQCAVAEVPPSQGSLTHQDSGRANFPASCRTSLPCLLQERRW